jgi:glycosyltransferase involved in cell wall biosynthesis
MARVLNLTITDADDDPRARRVRRAATAGGMATGSIPTQARTAATAPAARIPPEVRGVLRLARLALRTVRLARTAPGGYEIVHAHDLDTLPAGWIIARRHQARLVYDAHELYTGFDRNPPRLWLKVVSWLEGALARRADAIVTVSDAIADELVRRHRLARRPFVVLNVPELHEVELEPHQGPLRAIYQAAVGPGRHLADLPDTPGVEVSARVLGASSAPPHVRLLEPVATDHLVDALAEFDVGLVIDRPETDNARLALPNKLFEYLMAGLAVAVPNAPAMAELVEREGVGVVYQPGRLGEALAELAADRDRIEAMRRRARRVAVERYNAEMQRATLYEAWGL